MNAPKRDVAPWWTENSKEAASSGLADLAAGLKAFSDSRHGRRAGQRVGFPRFKGRGRSRESFRYTTGSFGVSSRTRLQLPRVGHVRTHEPTSKLARKLDAGEARVLPMTVAREGDRWLCAICCEVERSDRDAARGDSAVGVDAGVRHLAVLSTREQVPNPRAFALAQRRLRRFSARQTGSGRRTTPIATTSAAGRSRASGRPGGPPVSAVPSGVCVGCTPTPRTSAATRCTSSPPNSCLTPVTPDAA